jgi:cell surface protein SprA
MAVIDEPDGRIDKEWKKEAIKDSIANFGRNTSYKHKTNLSYTVPLNKFPITNWITANVKYGATYDWMGAPLGLVDTMGNSIGNTIKNTNTKTLNGQANLVNLYNKVKYLKKINQKYGKKRKKDPDEGYKIVTFQKENVNFKKDKAKSITHELGTKDITSVEVKDLKGKKVRGKLFIVSKDKITYELKKDIKNATVVVTAKKKKIIDFKKIMELTIRAAMGVRKVSLNYSESNGTVLPGYLPNTEYIGQDWDLNAPGLDFLLGYQPGHLLLLGNKPDAQIKTDRETWLHNFAENGWITSSPNQYNSYTQSNSQNLSLKATVEPLPGLRVDVTANRNETHNFREVFRDSTGFGDWSHESPMETGNFSISFFSLGTAFGIDDKDHVSKSFTEFANNRAIVSDQLAEEYVKRNPLISDPSQVYGFGNTSQEVLIPAFIGAYGGNSSASVLFDPFIKTPMPNWRVTYDGLSNIPSIKKYFKKVTIGHGYRSTFSVSSFTTNLNYEGEVGDNGMGFTEARDANGNYMSKYEIGQISIAEQLSPLIKVDVTWQNNMMTRVEIKKTRNITMSFSNNQLTEVRGNEVVVGAGYRFKEVELPFKIGRKRTQLKSDLNVKADFSMRSNTTIIRKLVENTNTPLKGQRITSIDVKADYVINQRFNIQAFYKRSGNKPFVSNLYNTSNSSAGITIRFTLAP